MDVRPEILELWNQSLANPIIKEEDSIEAPAQQQLPEEIEPEYKTIEGVRPEISQVWQDNIGKMETTMGGYADSAQAATGEDLAGYIGGQLVDPPEQQVGGDSMIGKIFDVLRRGEYASANLTKDYLLGKPFDMKSAVAGLKGEQQGTWKEITEAVFSEWSPWKRKAMELSLSIMADPTTYTPVGALGKSFKLGIEGVTPVKTLPGVLGLAKSGISKIPGAKKAGDVIEKSPVGKALVPGAGLPKPYYEAKYYAKKGLEAEEQRIFRQAEQLRKGITTKEMEELSFLRQHPDKISDISSALKAKLEKVGKVFDDFATKAEADGLITAEVAEKWRGRTVPYLPGYYPARGINLAKGDIPPSMFEKVKKPTFMKQKKFETLEDAKILSGKFEKIANAKTTEEAKGLIKSFELNDAFGKISNLKIEDIRGYAKQLGEHYKPEENVVKLVAYRGIEQARFTARKKFIDETLTTFGTKIKSGTKIVPEGQGIYLPKGAIRMYATEVSNPKFIDKLKGFADQLKDLRMKTEKVSTVKTTTETTVSGVGKLAESGPLAKMEGVVREALENRGMTAGEANVYIGKLKAQGSEGVDDVIKTMNEKSESIRTILDSKALEGDLIDISKLTDIQKKQMVGITTKVPTYSIPKEIADDLNFSTKIMGGDPATAKMFQLFDKTQNIWKGFATAVRLPFHLRNMYSNWWQAGLSGVRDPKRFTQAAKVQASFLTKANGKLELGDKVFTYKELRTLANDLGVRGKGWLGADIDVNMFDEIDSMVKLGKLRKLTPMKLGRNFGTMIEDNSRFAVFLDQLAKGKDPKEAARIVRKYMFDYEELTDFERKVMKRVIPFYTWTRKNAPLQVQSLIEQPRKYQMYAKTLSAFGEEETVEERMAKPEYFNKMLYVKSPFKSKLGKSLYMSIDLPPLEFNRVIDMNQWLSSSTPLKVIPELIWNFKTFPEPGKLSEQAELATAPFWVGWLPKPVFNQMHKKGLIDKRLNIGTGEYELGINKKLLHGIHTALPFLSEQSRIHAAPISLDDERPDLKRNSYLSGVGFKTLDTNRELGNRQTEADERMTVIQRFNQQRGRLPTVEELENLN